MCVLNKKVFEFQCLCNSFKGIQRDRFLKVVEKEATKEEQKKFLLNYLIHLKFEIRKCLKYIESNKEVIDICYEMKFKAKEKNKIKTLDRYNKLCRQCQEGSDACIRYLKAIGEFLFNTLPKWEGMFTDHEIAQIFSCNFNKVKKVHKIYDEYKKTMPVEEEGFLFAALYLWEIEYRSDYKGREKRIKDCSTYEIPFFSAISYFIFDEVIKERMLAEKYIVE